MPPRRSTERRAPPCVVYSLAVRRQLRRFLLSRQLSGAYGEYNTRDALRAAHRRHHIWGWIDNLEVQGGDIDHLVLAPSGIYAIDTKWHTTHLGDTTLHGGRPNGPPAVPV